MSTEIRRSLNLPIGGFQKQSLIDYPGNISAVLFTQGCNMRCSYCHNPELVCPENNSRSKKYDPNAILNWLKRHLELLDAVVITGGEPTVHPSLLSFMTSVKSMGLKIKLDTNGSNEKTLNDIITNRLADYIAMDIKAPLVWNKYSRLFGKVPGKKAFENIEQSVKLLKGCPVEHEFRTTLDHHVTVGDICEIMDAISGKYFVQSKLNKGTLRIEMLDENDKLKLEYFASQKADLNLIFR